MAIGCWIISWLPAVMANPVVALGYPISIGISLVACIAVRVQTAAPSKAQA
jgi:hypothetical protein